MSHEEKVTIDLFTTTDIKKARDDIKNQQLGKCAVTGLPLDRAVLDHNHDSYQLCRGVLESTINVFVGVIERGYLRYIKHWCKIPLPDLLRLVADYLDRTKDEHKYRHNHWMKKLQSRYNALPEGQKRSVLLSLGLGDGKNGIERKKLFQGALKTRKYSFDEVVKAIDKAKENV